LKAAVELYGKTPSNGVTNVTEVTAMADMLFDWLEEKEKGPKEELVRASPDIPVDPAPQSMPKFEPPIQADAFQGSNPPF
jgi:hypothetical protein